MWQDSFEESDGRRKVDVCKWIEELQAKLQTIRESVAEKEGKAKEVTKQYCDKGSKERKFEEGVLIRTPDINSKLDEA